MAECDSTATPWWVMSVAGAFVALGVVTLGYRVIQTLGSDIAEIDFHMAFCVESASTVTVVVATCLGLPISSTHCQVGAIVFVGMAKHGLHGSDCALFGKIALTWVATIPLAAAIAARLRVRYRSKRPDQNGEFVVFDHNYWRARAHDAALQSPSYAMLTSAPLLRDAAT